LTPWEMAHARMKLDVSQRSGWLVGLGGLKTKSPLRLPRGRSRHGNARTQVGRRRLRRPRSRAAHGAAGLAPASPPCRASIADAEFYFARAVRTVGAARCAELHAWPLRRFGSFPQRIVGLVAGGP
jgi:hypothetical protein